LVGTKVEVVIVEGGLAGLTGAITHDRLRVVGPVDPLPDRDGRSCSTSAAADVAWPGATLRVVIEGPSGAATAT
jgi:hypothetical protein